MLKIIPLILLILISQQVNAATYVRFSKLITFEDRFMYQPDNDMNDKAVKVEAWLTLVGSKLSEASITITPITSGAVDSNSLGINIPENYNYTYHTDSSNVGGSGDSSTWLWPYDSIDEFPSCSKDSLIN